MQIKADTFVSAFFILHYCIQLKYILLLIFYEGKEKKEYFLPQL